MFRGKSVVITGASSGLGAALAQEFAAAGARLALFATNEERLGQVAGRCEERGAEALVVSGDVTRPQDCKRLIDETAARFGSVDYLIANAGVSMWVKFEEVEDLDIFRRLIEVNYLGTLNCVHYALPHLKRSRGMIAAISSIQGRIGVPLHTGYVAAKHALQGFCDALRMELDSSGVDVLTVLPHWLEGTQLRRNALGRDGQPLGPSSRKHSKEAVSIEVASQAILDAIGKRRRQLIIPWKLKLLLGLNFIRPQWAEALINKAVGQQDS